jgi:GT2 family glycosyltransferase
MQNERVHIIIVNYQGWQDTIDCLHSVLQSSYRSFSVYVVDNHSGNHSLEQIREWLLSQDQLFPGGKAACSYYATVADFAAAESVQGNEPSVHLIQHGWNAGFAAANNEVLQKIIAFESMIWLLNPDMMVEKDTLTNLVTCYKSRDYPAVIGAAVFSQADKNRLLFYGGGQVKPFTATIRMNKRAEEHLDFISGACLFTGSAVFRNAGLLPEHYFLYWEETDWCRQVRQQGYELLVCSKAVCFDKISTVIGRGFLAEYYYTRNGLRFVSRYSRRNLPGAVVFVFARFFKKIMTGQLKRAGGVWRGLIDFLKKKQHALQ